MLTLLTTDAQLNVVGDPIVCWKQVEAVQRLNMPGSGQFTAPAYPWLLDQVEAAHRLMLIRNGSVWLSGPIEQMHLGRGVSGENSGVGLVRTTWADDMAMFGARVTYPDPALASNAQTTHEHWVTTGNAELALRTLVSGNAGPTALTPRQIPKLVLGDLAGVGNAVTFSTRFEVLTEALRTVAERGGGLAFRTRQVGRQILFEVRRPVDRSASLRFGFNLGNLSELEYTWTSPTASVVLVGGAGEGVNRVIVERTNADAVTRYGRSERFVDSRGADAHDELLKAGDEALTEGAETAQLTTVTVDTRYAHFGPGLDMDLGDLASVQVWPGREVTETIRSATLTATAGGGEQIAVTVGGQEAMADPEWVRKLRRVDRELRYLQANAE